MPLPRHFHPYSVCPLSTNRTAAKSAPEHAGAAEQATGALRSGIKTARLALQEVVGPLRAFEDRAKDIYQTGKAHSACELSLLVEDFEKSAIHNDHNPGSPGLYFEHWEELLYNVFLVLWSTNINWEVGTVHVHFILLWELRTSF